MLVAFENALVVRLDALSGERYPTWGLTTTTTRPHMGSSELRLCEANLFRSLRRMHPARDVQYLGFVEFTTGNGKHSGGQRRAHVHHLVKGLGRPDNERAAVLEAKVSDLWKKYTGDAWRVECRPLRTPLGAIAYLSLHHHKNEQRPPVGWKGRRFRSSQGYFSEPVGELRATARELLKDKRIERELIDGWGIPDRFDSGDLDDLLMDALPPARALAAFNAPRLVMVGKDGDVTRMRH